VAIRGASGGGEVVEMKQAELFPEPLLPFQGGAPLARATDSASSHLAAQEHVASGRAKRNMERCLDFVFAHPGLTSKQLAALPECELGRHEVARRLADAKNAGLVEAREGTGKTKEYTWWPV
jgi:hypothetical protein